MNEVKYRRLLNTSTLTETLSPLVKRSTNRVINDAVQLASISINSRLEKMGWMNTLPSVTVYLKKNEVAKELGITMKQVSNALQILRTAGIISAETKNDGKGWLNLWRIDFSNLKRSVIIFAEISYTEIGKIITEVKSSHAGFKTAKELSKDLEGGLRKTRLYPESIDSFEEMRESILAGKSSYEEYGSIEKYNMLMLLGFKG